jgi:hypothetical protein
MLIVQVYEDKNATRKAQKTFSDVNHCEHFSSTNFRFEVHRRNTDKEKIEGEIQRNELACFKWSTSEEEN